MGGVSRDCCLLWTHVGALLRVGLDLAVYGGNLVSLLPKVVFFFFFCHRDGWAWKLDWRDARGPLRQNAGGGSISDAQWCLRCDDGPLFLRLTLGLLWGLAGLADS